MLVKEPEFAELKNETVSRPFRRTKDSQNNQYSDAPNLILCGTIRLFLNLSQRVVVTQESTQKESEGVSCKSPPITGLLNKHLRAIVSHKPCREPRVGKTLLQKYIWLWLVPHKENPNDIHGKSTPFLREIFWSKQLQLIMNWKEVFGSLYVYGQEAGSEAFVGQNHEPREQRREPQNNSWRATPSPNHQRPKLGEKWAGL